MPSHEASEEPVARYRAWPAVRGIGVDRSIDYLAARESAATFHRHRCLLGWMNSRGALRLALRQMLAWGKPPTAKSWR